MVKNEQAISEMVRKMKASQKRGFFRLCNYFIERKHKGNTIPTNINNLLNWYIKNILL